MSHSPISSTSACCVFVVARDEGLARRLVTLIAKEDVSSDVVPWTIANKYYTADVHFHIHAKLSPPNHPSDENEKVPAVLYVFEMGQTYRSDFLAFQSSMTAHDSEVCMALGAPGTRLQEEQDEESIVDDFFAQHGFEFAHMRETPRSFLERDDDERDDSIPDIGRVRDALHAIMWPSMTRTTRSKPSAKGVSRAAPLPIALEQEDDFGPDDIALRLDVGDITEDQAKSLFSSSTDHELEALEKWLDEDEDAGISSTWRPPSSDSNEVSFKSVSARSSADAFPQTDATGFDDDFSEFVSASTPSQINSQINDNDASLLPTRSEIAATTARIFGPPPPSQPSASSSSRGTEEAGAGSFDLSQIFSVLQSMREEISGIEDERERRKAAAKAALGLVEGLDLDFGEDGDDDGDELSELGEIMRVD